MGEGEIRVDVVFCLDQCDALAMHWRACKTRLTLSISFHPLIPIFVDCGVRYLGGRSPKTDQS